ncbi:hypothetical protein BJ170DRAFT_589673 [Xylariales sp. AK1849]|nr:hypothetical protein BJ170DRAFT_589673 [Xylariales sp. AK1849]
MPLPFFADKDPPCLCTGLEMVTRLGDTGWVARKFPPSLTAISRFIFVDFDLRYIRLQHAEDFGVHGREFDGMGSNGEGWEPGVHLDTTSNSNASSSETVPVVQSHLAKASGFKDLQTWLLTLDDVEENVENIDLASAVPNIERVSGPRIRLAQMRRRSLAFHSEQVPFALRKSDIGSTYELIGETLRKVEELLLMGLLMNYDA